MLQKGKVISTDGNTAKVLVVRKSACEGCRQKNLCAGIGAECSEAKPVEIKVINSAGAQQGDEVLLSAKSSLILGSTFAVFILPIIIAFAVYYTVYSINGSAFAFASAAALGAFIISIVSLCLGLNRYMKKNLCVEIVKIL